MQHNTIMSGRGAINQLRIISQYTNIMILAIINKGNTYTHIAEAMFPTGDESPPYNPTIVKMLITNWSISIISETYFFTASFPILLCLYSNILLDSLYEVFYLERL